MCCLCRQLIAISSTLLWNARNHVDTYYSDELTQANLDDIILTWPGIELQSFYLNEQLLNIHFLYGLCKVFIVCFFNFCLSLLHCALLDRIHVIPILCMYCIYVFFYFGYLLQGYVLVIVAIVIMGHAGQVIRLLLFQTNGLVLNCWLA